MHECLTTATVAVVRPSCYAPSSKTCCQELRACCCSIICVAAKPLLLLLPLVQAMP